MSYKSQSQLENNGDFQQRTRAVCVQQANIFRADARPAWVSVANGVLKDEGNLWPTFNRLAAGAPGFADKVEQPNGDVDQTLITDEELLSVTQASWPIVAELYYNEDGTPIGG